MSSFSEHTTSPYPNTRRLVVNGAGFQIVADERITGTQPGTPNVHVSTGSNTPVLFSFFHPQPHHVAHIMADMFAMTFNTQSLVGEQ